MLWLVLLVVFAGVEGLTAGLISIWFCAGSLAALFAAMAHTSIWVQVGVFAAVSFLAMAVIRPIAKKHWQPTIQKTNVDSILGSEGLVTEAIDNIRGSGQVKIGEGDFTFYVKNGALIENGRLTMPVKDINIIGNGPQALADITAVADDLKIDEGTWTCGKEQSVPVSCGIPSVLIKSLTVGGE